MKHESNSDLVCLGGVIRNEDSDVWGRDDKVHAWILLCFVVIAAATCYFFGARALAPSIVGYALTMILWVSFDIHVLESGKIQEKWKRLVQCKNRYIYYRANKDNYCH